MRSEARAPGKVILFGEHAINRGQPAIAAAVGLFAQSYVQEANHFAFCSGHRSGQSSAEEIGKLTAAVDSMREAQAFDEIRALAASDFFAPQKYILGKIFGRQLPRGFDIRWKSEIPPSSGLGSGGAAFTAMVAALLPWLKPDPDLSQRAACAQLGDVIAHGGIASGLDTQTSLLGGVIRFTGQEIASRIPCAAGASLIVADSGVTAATSEVNSRVRCWLAEKPNSRIQYLQTIGALTRAALPLLERGDWDELGRLMNLNQLVLEKIGVSCPEIDCLIDAALKSGAFGAKISGSGGGGIIIALVAPDRKELVMESLRAAGGSVLTPEFGVPGACEQQVSETSQSARSLSFHAISNY
jgi:mevalonate kinase